MLLHVLARLAQGITPHGGGTPATSIDAPIQTAVRTTILALLLKRRSGRYRLWWRGASPMQIAPASARPGRPAFIDRLAVGFGSVWRIVPGRVFDEVDAALGFRRRPQAGVVGVERCCHRVDARICRLIRR